MSKTSKGSKGGTSAQPLDPTRNAVDWFGDPSGLTGITTGKTPNSDAKLAPELYDDDEYNKSINRTMSSTKAAQVEDIASEEETDLPTTRQNLRADFDGEPYTVNVKDAAGNDSPGSDAINTTQQPYAQPDYRSEQAISGSMPDPTSDDDTLEVAQAMGMQLEEDDEHPQELNIARDIDQAEEDLRTH
jgi:hypothetical protein